MSGSWRRSANCFVTRKLLSDPGRCLVAAELYHFRENGITQPPVKIQQLYQ